MNLLRFRQAAAIVTALFLIPASFAQETRGDKVDLDALAQIKAEAFQHSQVMENLRIWFLVGHQSQSSPQGFND